MRIDGRQAGDLREVKITPDYLRFAEGSVLIDWGKNRVLCAATVENRVPPHLAGTGTGWVTAEYAMLPRSAKTRIGRERERLNRRSVEIERLIGRSLRAAVDLKALGERSILIDCDVIESDGGTRTASITGAWVALALALGRMRQDGQASANILRRHVAAVSVGVVEGRAVLDLNYLEDSQAEVDMNVVMTDAGEYIELQGTAEGKPFSRARMEEMLGLAAEGVKRLVGIQRAIATVS
jgi:ribonuclease PH